MRRKLLKSAIMVLLLLLLPIGYNHFYNSSKITILHYSKSLAENIWVYETKNLRCMSFIPPGSTVQACIDYRNPDKIVLNYHKLLIASLLIKPNPKKILIIGLGGGRLVHDFHNLLPEAEIDVVEINKQIVKLAQQYFYFTLNPKLKLFIQDGAKFISNKSNSKTLYDIVIIDAFTENYIPPSFRSQTLIHDIRNILNPDGVVAVNTFSNSVYYNIESQLYWQVFGPYYNLKDSNRVILASKTPKLDISTIRSNAKLWKASFNKFNIDMEWLLAKFTSFTQ